MSHDLHMMSYGVMLHQWTLLEVRHCRKVREKVDSSRPVSILLNKTAMVLSARGGVHCRPAMGAVIAQTVYIATEIWSILAITMDTVTFITRLIV